MQKNQKFPNFFFFFLIMGADSRVWGSVHGKRTTSITTNHPCLITSVELDSSWEGFSASEKIPRSGVGGVGSWIGNKAAELLWTGWFGSMGLRFSSSWNRCLTTSRAERNPSLTKLGGWGTHLVTTSVGILLTVFSWDLGNPVPMYNTCPPGGSVGQHRPITGSDSDPLWVEASLKMERTSILIW